MERLKLLIASPRWLALAALALVSLGLGATLLSGASFTSRSGNSASLAAGSLQLTSSRPGQAIVAASGMLPGDSRSGSIEITNSGNVAGKVTLQIAELVDSPSGSALSGTLELSIQDITGGGTSQVWSGKLGTLNSVSVGSFDAGQTRSYRFTLSWPSGVSEATLQGASTSFAFEWVGVS